MSSSIPHIPDAIDGAVGSETIIRHFESRIYKPGYCDAQHDPAGVLDDRDESINQPLFSLHVIRQCRNHNHPRTAAIIHFRQPGLLQYRPAKSRKPRFRCSVLGYCMISARSAAVSASSRTGTQQSVHRLLKCREASFIQECG